MARPLFRNLMRRQPLLAQPYSFTSTLAQQFHMTATNLTRRNLTSINPPLPKTFPAKIQSLYTDDFPYTLHYYCTYGPKLALRDCSKLEGNPDKLLRTDPHYCNENHVSVNEDGIVDPANTSEWNGVPMFPNTKYQHAFIDNKSEWADILRKARGQDVPTAWMFTVPRGTPLPHSLFLVHEDDEHKVGESFYLMPRKAMPLLVLNKELNDFFNTNGLQNPVDDMWRGFYDEGYNTYDDEWKLR